ncbi:hypothetical protein TWF106_006421 [Orbilia oligospora]|uniref:Uncharacterized protein n=1 Tax=Orbilia oligospora TaxID=2813651 RepID=A0A7C8UX59_ORBOL|nr:hypothetical protein TWF106_006421 [Orbilia oligospora]
MARMLYQELEASWRTDKLDQSMPRKAQTSTADREYLAATTAVRQRAISQDRPPGSILKLFRKKTPLTFTSAQLDTLVARECDAVAGTDIRTITTSASASTTAVTRFYQIITSTKAASYTNALIKATEFDTIAEVN